MDARSSQESNVSDPERRCSIISCSVDWVSMMDGPYLTFDYASWDWLMEGVNKRCAYLLVLRDGFLRQVSSKIVWGLGGEVSFTVFGTCEPCCIDVLEYYSKCLVYRCFLSYSVVLCEKDTLHTKMEVRDEQHT